MMNVLVYDVEAEELAKIADEHDTTIAEIVEMLVWDYLDEVQK